MPSALPEGDPAPADGRLPEPVVAQVGRRPFGVYLHVPFCTRRCDYCAFATWTDRYHLIPAYLDACRRELASGGLASGRLASRRLACGRSEPGGLAPAASRGVVAPATSVFVGGGTPSLLAPGDMASLLGAVARFPDAEVTVECNPETVTAERLAGYADAGATRLSFGVQSMVPSVLAALGRAHEPACARSAVAAAAAVGFGERYSVDLIYGAVNETLDDWRRTVETVLAFDPPPAHVSAYALTPEPGTPLGADRSRHPDGDDQADKYLVADRLLTGAGLDWYELSNWARPGAECRHNQLYWAQGPYRGIGCAAHSHELLAAGGSRRWWNVRTPERYIRLAGHGEAVIAAEDLLDERGRKLEGLQLALRTRTGVPAGALADDPRIDGLVESRVIPGFEHRRLVLTPEGRLLANEVALRLQV